MIAITFFLVIGLVFVIVLILGVALAARKETRTAGFWILGGTLGLAVMLPLAWLLVRFDGGATTVVTNANGQQIQMQRGPVPDEAVTWFVVMLVGIGMLVGEVLLLINPRTRTVGYVFLGIGLAAILFIVPASVRQEAPTYVYRSEQASPPSTRVESHRLPVLEKETVADSSDVAIPATPLAPQPSTETETITDAPTADVPVASTPGNGAAKRTAGAANTPAVSVDADLAANDLPASVDLAGNELPTGDKDSLPEWAKQGGGIAADGTYYAVVKSGPYRTFNDCWQNLRRHVDSAARDYGSRHGNSFRNRWPNRGMPDHLVDRLVAQRFLERGDFSVGEMMTLYARLDFSEQNIAAIDAWQSQLLATNRTLFAGIFGGLIVALVGIAYAYFRVDTATLGYYTWRLRVAAAVLMIVVVVAGFISGAIFFDEEWRLGGIVF